MCKGMGRSDEGQRERFRNSAIRFGQSERLFTALLRTRTEGPKSGLTSKWGGEGNFWREARHQVDKAIWPGDSSIPRMALLNDSSLQHVTKYIEDGPCDLLIAVQIPRKAEALTCDWLSSALSAD